MAFTKTIIRILSENRSFEIPADMTESQVRSGYGSNLPQLANMVCTETTESTPTGDARVLTFTQRLGNKGA